MDRYYKHTKLLGLLVILLLLISGCTNSSNPVQPIDQDTPEKIIGVEIQLPVKHNNGITTNPEDIEIFQEELLALGAAQITVIMEKDGNSTVITPAEFSVMLREGDYTGVIKIYAEGDYDVLSEGLAKESSIVFALQKFEMEVYINPYYENENA